MRIFKISTTMSVEAIRFNQYGSHQSVDNSSITLWLLGRIVFNECKYGCVFSASRTVYIE